MKIKLDENVPTDLTEPLKAAGHDVDTVTAEGLRGRPDADLWDATRGAGRFLITQDLDFSDVRRFEPGTHPGLLLVRLRTPTRRRLVERLGSVMRSTDLAQWRGCVVVVSDHRIRVRRAESSAGDS